MGKNQLKSRLPSCLQNGRKAHTIVKSPNYTLSFHTESDTYFTWSWKRVVKFSIYCAIFSYVSSLMIFQVSKSDIVCYSRVGCFSVAEPWSERSNIFNFFPQSPTHINTTFIITSRRIPNGTLIFPGMLQDITKFQWGNHKGIVFIIHGFTDDTTTWAQDLKNACLNLDDVTVILVDWRVGASGYYPQVVANTRIVAQEISLFIRHLRTLSNAPRRIHLVGHSLGSHIASYVGKAQRKPKIIQITALDPAFPLFEGFSPKIRLNKSDAHHVVVFHSNVGPWGLGMKDPVGTVDIYLNNGRDQRGCMPMTSLLENPIRLKGGMEARGLSNFKDLIACSHRRAYEVLLHILKSVASVTYLVAYPTNSTHPTRAAKHSFCERKSSCWKFLPNRETFFTLPPKRNQVSTYFMQTSDRSPFCVQFGFFEMTTCPQQFPEMGDNGKLKISYLAFGEEVNVFHNQNFGKQRIGFWTEFACNAINSMSNVTVTLSMTREQSISNKAARKQIYSRNRAFCVMNPHLTFYESGAKKTVRFLPMERGPRIQIAYNTCFKIDFSSLL